MPAVGTTRTFLAEWAAACSAAATTLRLLGNTTTCSADDAAMAARISSVDGLADCPPLTICRAPSERNIRFTPSPEATATTALVTGSSGGSSWLPLAAASRTQRSSSTCSARSVTWISAGPADLDGRFDGPADLVGVDMTLVEAIAADDDDRAAIAGPHGPERRYRLVRRLQEEHDLVTQVGGLVAFFMPLMAQVVPLSPGERREQRQ